MSHTDDDARPPFTDEASDAYESEPDELRATSAEDLELNSLLARWSVPEASGSMDERIIAAYRQQTARPTLRGLANQNSNATSSSTESKEVVIMKQCSVCREEFANKFSFCPVDGTPLNELAAAIVSSPAPDEGRAQREAACP